MNSHSGKRWRRLGILSLAGLLSAGCADFALTLNDRSLYTPPGLFGNYTVRDDALAQCLAQHIIDQRVTRPEELLILNCSHAGIADLAGLEIFTGLEQVRLSANDIKDASALVNSPALKVLILDNNQLQGAFPFAALKGLSRLNLDGNLSLLCPGEGKLPAAAKVTLPAHCLQADG